MKDIELLTDENTETTASLSQLESLPQQVIKEQLLEPFFDKRELNALRQLRASSKTLQTAVDAQDEQNYRAKKAIKQIAVGAWHNLVLLENGNVYAWGENHTGQLGLGDLPSIESPQRVDLPGPVKQIVSAPSSNMALLTNGQVYVWGNNTVGQLGLGDPSPRNRPVLLNLPAPAKHLVMGQRLGSFAQLENGQVYTWGWNPKGQLGLGDTNKRSTPVPLTLPAPVKKLVHGDSYSLALLENGKFYGWGGSSDKPLGIDGLVNSLQPQEMTFASPVKDIVDYGLHHLVLLDNGDVHVWDKDYGKVQNAEHETAVNFIWRRQKPLSSLPAQVKQYCEKRLYESDRTYRHGLALLPNNELYCWKQEELSGEIVEQPRKLNFEFCEKPLLEKTEAKVRATLD